MTTTADLPTTGVLPDEQGGTDENAATEAAMRAAGVSTEEPTFVDYFNTDTTVEVALPDGKQTVTIQMLSEGKRRKYLNAINKDVVVQRTTGDARMRMAPGDDRYALLTESIVGWTLLRGGKPVAFDGRTLDQFLTMAPPTVLDVIEKEVRRLNPWLAAELTVEQIDQQIEALKEQRDVLIRRQEGN